MLLVIMIQTIIKIKMIIRFYRSNIKRIIIMNIADNNNTTTTVVSTDNNYKRLNTSTWMSGPVSGHHASPSNQRAPSRDPPDLRR